MTVTLLIGGARSGKSMLAVRMGVRHDGPVTFIATAEPGDDDMSARIRKHRQERPSAWVTVEAPHDVADAICGASARAFVIVDCLTLWVANRMLGGVSSADIEQEAEKLAAAATSRASVVVVVTNEVGMSVVPDTFLGREYRDVLGRVNTIVSASAEHAYLVVAGRFLELASPDAVLR